MIFGIGTDIVEIERINNMNSLDGFVKKILSKNEKQFFENLKDIKKIGYLAKQFAGKEAFVKALGTGFKHPIFPKDIQILRNADGKPEILLSADAKSYVEDLGITKSHVSLADESNHLLAFAVLET